MKKENKRNVEAILRVFITIFGEISGALLISLPTSKRYRY